MDSLGYISGAAIALFVFILLRSGVLHGGNNRVDIPGPPSPSWLFGNLLQLVAPYQYGDYEFKWQKLYGPLYRVKGCFGEDRLIVSDPVALQSIVNGNKFDHSPLLNNLHKLLYSKKSLVIVRDENYRRLRAAFSSSFSAARVRQYQFAMEKAAEEMTKEIENSSTQLIDVCPFLAIATLGAISEAVIGCSKEELGDEFVQICSRVVGLATQSDTASLLMKALGTRLPGWFWGLVSLLPTPTFNEMRRGQDLAMQIGTRIVHEKVNAAKRGLELNNDAFSHIVASEHWERTIDAEELAAHVSLLVIAGQETTAKTLAFALLELARNPELQDSLRREVHASRGPDEVGYNNMTLLNAFIKEVLRFYPVVPLEERIAIEDTVLPVSDKVTSSTGERLCQIPIHKGQIVSLAIASYQRAEALWGEDAEEFKPSRWIEGTTFQGDAIGPYANLLTFFGGPRSCLGWRFAILEMQVIISELVKKFSFQLPEGDSIRMFGATVMEPIMATGEKGARLRVTRLL